jgi:hypothetical protein
MLLAHPRCQRPPQFGGEPPCRASPQVRASIRQSTLQAVDPLAVTSIT